jgi:hypothetical protein
MEITGIYVAAQIYYRKNPSSFNVIFVTTGNDLWNMKTMEEYMY